MLRGRRCARESACSPNGSAEKGATGCRVRDRPLPRVNRAMILRPTRLAFLIVLACCAAAPRPAPPAQAPAAPTATAAPAEPPFPPPAFADPQERAAKLAAALPELEALFDEQFTSRKAPGMSVALVV